MKINQIGRSMVEMLGVLAIIGVLSVGSIAGYSKAMNKYKLNKHAESLNMLLSNALQLSSSINKAKSGGNNNDIYYNEFLNKAKLLPDGIVYKKESWNQTGLTKNDYLVDTFGNKMSFYSRTSYDYSFGLFIALGNNSYSRDICHNIINMAREHSSNIIRVAREVLVSSNNWSNSNIYSDCSKGTCFNNFSVTDIHDMCKISDKNSKDFYYFYILW